MINTDNKPPVILYKNGSFENVREMLAKNITQNVYFQKIKMFSMWEDYTENKSVQDKIITRGGSKL